MRLLITSNEGAEYSEWSSEGRRPPYLEDNKQANRICPQRSRWQSKTISGCQFGHNEPGSCVSRIRSRCRTPRRLVFLGPPSPTAHINALFDIQYRTSQGGIRTQYPLIIPFLNPDWATSAKTARSRLSSAEPYWPCMRTLNISTNTTRGIVRHLARGEIGCVTWASEDGVRSAGHASGDGRLPERELRERRDDPLGGRIGCEKERVDACDAQERARHAYRREIGRVSERKGTMQRMTDLCTKRRNLLVVQSS